MAPKRKADKYAYVDLTQDQDDDDDVVEVPKKRQRRQKKSAEDDTGAGTSQQPAGAQKPKGKRSSSKASSVEDTQAALEAALAAAPPKPKGRKKAQPDEERRLAPSGATVTYRPRPSQQVQDRIARAMPGSSHRMFLVDSSPLRPQGAEGGAAAEYHVLGATGNVYRVEVSRHPHCSCPDFARGHLCKHWLFVLLRVLRQSPDNPVIWQRALLTSEVNALLGEGPGGPGAVGGPGAAADPSVLAGERVRQRFAQLAGGKGQGAAAEGAGGGGGVQRPVEGDCPICYDELGGEAVTFCRACGNNMHVECFKKWSSSRSSHGQAVTCVLCRAPWQAEGGPGAGGSGPSRYLNLAAYSEAHQAGGGPSLDALYGSTAVFVRANQGGLSRRAALQQYMAEQGLA